MDTIHQYTQRRGHPYISLLLIVLLGTGNAHAQIARPALTGIAFVELQVSDLEKASDFYSGLLGYRARRPLPAKKDRWIYYDVNEMQSIRVKAGLPPGQDERLLSVAFETVSAGEMRRYLESKAVEVPAAVAKEPGGEQWFQVEDPAGHTIKFIQYAFSTRKTAVQDKGISATILHAGITVTDTAATNAFYRDILGFSETWRGGANDSVTSWINMHVPEGTAYLEYMLVKGPVTRQQLGSLHHIALMVPDMQQALNTLRTRAAGRSFTLPAPRVGRNKRWQLNLFDADGTRIELMEPFTMR